jgi:hypothetical protein
LLQHGWMDMVGDWGLNTLLTVVAYVRFWERCGDFRMRNGQKNPLPHQETEALKSLPRTGNVLLRCLDIKNFLTPLSLFHLLEAIYSIEQPINRRDF